MPGVDAVQFVARALRNTQMHRCNTRRLRKGVFGPSFSAACGEAGFACCIRITMLHEEPRHVEPVGERSTGRTCLRFKKHV